MSIIFDHAFFSRKCQVVGQDLVGKLLIHRVDGVERRVRICETEAYDGECDSACHAFRGRTRRTDVMYGDAGVMYVYLCYGIHHLLNIVTGDFGYPEAVLIRAALEARGPGKLTKYLGVDRSYNGCQLIGHSELRLEDDGFRSDVEAMARVGIDYALEEDRFRLWRYVMRG